MKQLEAVDYCWILSDQFDRLGFRDDGYFGWITKLEVVAIVAVGDVCRRLAAVTTFEQAWAAVDTTAASEPAAAATGDQEDLGEQESLGREQEKEQLMDDSVAEQLGLGGLSASDDKSMGSLWGPRGTGTGTDTGAGAGEQRQLTASEQDEADLTAAMELSRQLSEETTPPDAVGTEPAEPLLPPPAPVAASPNAAALTRISEFCAGVTDPVSGLTRLDLTNMLRALIKEHFEWVDLLSDRMERAGFAGQGNLLYCDVKIEAASIVQLGQVCERLAFARTWDEAFDACSNEQQPPPQPQPQPSPGQTLPGDDADGAVAYPQHKVAWDELEPEPEPEVLAGPALSLSEGGGDGEESGCGDVGGDEARTAQPQRPDGEISAEDGSSDAAARSTPSSEVPAASVGAGVGAAAAAAGGDGATGGVVVPGRPVGLPNISGADCFWLSTLQCMHHIDRVRELLFSAGSVESEHSNEPSSALVRGITTVFDAMRECHLRGAVESRLKPNAAELLALRGLLEQALGGESSLVREFPILQRQQCAHEFFSTLVDALGNAKEFREGEAQLQLQHEEEEKQADGEEQEDGVAAQKKEWQQQLTDAVASGETADVLMRFGEMQWAGDPIRLRSEIGCILQGQRIVTTSCQVRFIRNLASPNFT